MPDAAKPSSLMMTMLNNSRRARGRSSAAITADPAERFYLGVPAPPLAYQYLVGVDIFPLNTLVELHGDEATNKTSLSFEIGRWFLDHGGNIAYLDVEGKYPVDIARSLLALERYGEHVYICDREFLTSAEDAQREALTILEASKKSRAETNAYNAEHPEAPRAHECTLIILDSFAAALSQQQAQKILKEGHAGAYVAPYAKTWSPAIVKIANELSNSNATLLIINHERMSINLFGPSSRTTPGPRAKNYLKTLDIRTSPIRVKDEEFSDTTERPIRLTIEKNSGGPPGKKLHELVFSWNKAGEFKFDWALAAVRLLHSYLESGHTLGTIDALTVKKARGANHRIISCPGLGVTKDTLDEFLARIQGDAALMALISQELGIRCRPKLGEQMLLEEPPPVEDEEEDLGEGDENEE